MVVEDKDTSPKSENDPQKAKEEKRDTTDNANITQTIEIADEIFKDEHEEVSRYITQELYVTFKSAIEVEYRKFRESCLEVAD